MRKFLRVGVLVGAVLTSAEISAALAAVEPIEAGSLIIPMDIDYQNTGMLKAFGLLDKLLRAGVPVRWSVRPDKTLYMSATAFPPDPGNTVDFVATATDFKTGASIGSHGYRGGPFLIRAEDAAAASPIITSWQSLNTTTVHVATQAFSAPVRLVLTAAPRLAVLADGNQAIAFSYLNAAGIPDESNLAWSATSQDLLTPAAVEGPTATDHSDGVLFRPSGMPAFCALLTPHWQPTLIEVPEGSAEIAAFLDFPVHLSAECFAVKAIEGEPPTGGRQHLLTSAGFVATSAGQPNSISVQVPGLPFAQFDGPFGTVGGAVPSFALTSGSSYFDGQGVLIKDQTQPVGVRDILIAGYAGGTCPISSLGGCTNPGPKGTVIHLGGHQYSTSLPMTFNPTTQGTRLFLESLYAGNCVTSEGQPHIVLTASAPSTTTEPLVRFTITAVNEGPGPALAVTLHDIIPVGATFEAASDGGALAGSEVTWSLGDLPAGAPARSVNLDVRLGSLGAYDNRASATLSVGLTPNSVSSNTTSTSYVSPGEVPDGLLVPGAELLLHPSTNGQVLLEWGSSCRAGVDYAVYEGTIGLFYSHAARVCSTAGATMVALTPGAGNTYYLVVPLSSGFEGGYGADSEGSPIPTGSSECRSSTVPGCP